MQQHNELLILIYLQDAQVQNKKGISLRKIYPKYSSNFQCLASYSFSSIGS